LADLGEAIGWLAGRSVGRIYHLLRRLGFSRKAAQKFVRSPDPNDDCKWRAILRAYAHQLAEPGQAVLLWLDEVSFYRQPSVAPAYHPQGATQPHARQQPGPNTQTRILASLDAASGRVVYRQWSHVNLKAFCAFAQQLRAAYPSAKTVYVVMDNWPTHTSPQALAAFQAAGLRPLFLPTYASWLNPIEKLWRWLRQSVIHLHPYAAELATLRQHVRDFLDQFAVASPQLLRYVGLPVD
jgi:transposase